VQSVKDKNKKRDFFLRRFFLPGFTTQRYQKKQEKQRPALNWLALLG